MGSSSSGCVLPSFLFAPLRLLAAPVRKGTAADGHGNGSDSGWGAHGWQTGNRGFGLKTMRPIKKGEFVVEYRGEVSLLAGSGEFPVFAPKCGLDARVATYIQWLPPPADHLSKRKLPPRLDRLQRQRFLVRPRGVYPSLSPSVKGVRTTDCARVCVRSSYFMDYDGFEVVDAGQRGNCARFINHSCGPNLEVVRWRLAQFEEYQVTAEFVVANRARTALTDPSRFGQMGLFALHDIPVGTELTCAPTRLCSHPSACGSPETDAVRLIVERRRLWLARFFCPGAEIVFDRCDLLGFHACPHLDLDSDRDGHRHRHRQHGTDRSLALGGNRARQRDRNRPFAAEVLLRRRRMFRIPRRPEESDDDAGSESRGRRCRCWGRRFEERQGQGEAESAGRAGRRRWRRDDNRGAGRVAR